MNVTQAADRIAMYGTRAESADLWTAIVGDARAGVHLTQLGRGLRTMSSAQLEQLPHMGPARAARVLATVELARRIMSAPLKRGCAIRCPQDVVDAYGSRLMDLERESVWGIYVTVRNRVICDEMIAIGSVDRCAVSPADILRTALRVAAPRIFLVHSHPNSGDPRPSSEDDALTKRLLRAAKYVDVDLLDHIVVGEGGAFYSYAEQGRLTP